MDERMSRASCDVKLGGERVVVRDAHCRDMSCVYVQSTKDLASKSQAPAYDDGEGKRWPGMTTHDVSSCASALSCVMHYVYDACHASRVCTTGEVEHEEEQRRAEDNGVKGPAFYEVTYMLMCGHVSMLGMPQLSDTQFMPCISDTMHPISHPHAACHMSCPMLML